MPSLPYNYKIIEQDSWKPGRLAGSSEPGGGHQANESKIISMLQQGEKFEDVVAPELLMHLNAIYEEGVRTIYNLILPQSKLSEYVWKNKFNDTKYLTEIKGVNIGIEDFHAPTQEQLQLITDDAFCGLKNGENLLVHCHGGLGRTGTIIAAIYMRSNQVYDYREAINYVREKYNSYAVESAAQMHCLENFGNYINSVNAIRKITSSNESIEANTNSTINKSARSSSKRSF